MKDDAERKEDGVKKEPKNGSDADEVLEATKVIVEANNNIAETIGDIDVDETVLMRALMMWVRAVYNEIILIESSWWFCPFKCRSHNKTYKGLERSGRFPPRGWLKFNVCGVVFEDKAGGGGVLRDENEAKGVELAELKLTGVALEL
ncbi:hypothetical protein ES332_D01G042100v1 [Gossypium tomentosum]|uniref:Uncharacterized protein n=1 Tax=Gossypium tomentosum TaxID=34277 RepID=A0A5D2M4W3_GOSTO|nr:hypothetical protein ES332_D01G042100v1 [Gossypium tomentosum]